jgi:hypothetical protein
MEVVAMLFTYPTNIHMLRFNTNRPLSGFPSKKGLKTSKIPKLTRKFSILAEFLENVKIGFRV